MKKFGTTIQVKGQAVDLRNHWLLLQSQKQRLMTKNCSFWARCHLTKSVALIQRVRTAESAVARQRLQNVLIMTCQKKKFWEIYDRSDQISIGPKTWVTMRNWRMILAVLGSSDPRPSHNSQSAAADLGGEVLEGEVLGED